MEELLENLCTGSALIVMDFKMKFLPQYWREITLQHYGKRGISWAGSMIYIRSGESFDVYYIDCISENDMKQDCGLVLSVVDITLARLSAIRPDIKIGFFQTVPCP
jgi:hypothetical protein